MFVGVRRRFAAQGQAQLSAVQERCQVLHVKLLPGGLPGCNVALPGGFAQAIDHDHVVGDLCCAGCRQAACTVHPERIDREPALGHACVVDRVVVEQHLHLALQAAQAGGHVAIGDPGFDIHATHSVQRSGLHALKDGAAGVPHQGTVPLHLEPIFLQKGLHGVQQLLRLLVTQTQKFGLQHGHLVHANLPVAGRDPGLRCCVLGVCPGRPGQWPPVGPAQGPGLGPLMRHVGAERGVGVFCVAMGACHLPQQPAQMGEFQAVQGVQRDACKGGIGNDQVHGLRLSQAFFIGAYRFVTIEAMAIFKNIPYELVLGWRYTRAGRATRRNGFISFISGVSMLGIGLGVAALIIVLSVMNGFQREVRDRMLGVVSHIEVYAADGAALADVPGTLAQVKASPEVVAAAPFISAQALLARGDDMKGVLVRGIDPALEPQVSDLQSDLQGQVLSRLQPGQFGVVLGRDLAQNLGVTPGDLVTLVSPSGQVTPAGVLPRMKQMTVLGTFSSGHYEYDSSLALMHVEDAARMFRLEGPSGVRIKLRDLHQAREVAQQLQMQLGLGFHVRDWTQQNRTWFAAVQVEKRMMFIILTLIVAVAAFNLVSTLVMTVTDKRADIAILRTLGASPRSIMGIFVVQGAAVGVMGTLGGLALGLLVAFNIDVIVPALERLFSATFLPQDIYLIRRMPSEPLASDIVPIAVISLVLAFAATLYPSWRASRVNPAEALRYE